MKVQLSKGRVQYAMTLVFIALTLWSAYHVVNIVKVGSLQQYVYTNWVFLFSFAMIVVSTTLAYREKPYKAAPGAESNQLITAVVPTYNEDPEILKDCLRSLVVQSRQLQEIYVVNDGSNMVCYDIVRLWFEKFTAENNVQLHWINRENGGKRQAQASAFVLAENTDIFVTVDSDSVLDFHAIEELMKPFADHTVQSVAGVVIARNNRNNLLARITDLLFVVGQLTDRSMMSSLGSVLVNSGGLAAYRADIILKNIDAYTNESFFGRHIEFSDDSMLTLYALGIGKTVQQPTAFVFAMMPDKVSHHVRQQIRWMKGSFIRSWWRIKYLPVNSFGFARQALGWSQFVMSSMLVVLLLVFKPHVNMESIFFIILIPILVGYAQALRYFSVQRSDESIFSQFLTYMLTPVAVLWSYFVLRPIRVYATLTCFNVGWGTRKSVEVELCDMPVMSFGNRILMIGRSGFYVETYYEYLGRSMRFSRLNYDEALLFWIEHYYSLPFRKRLALWKDYEKVRIRKLKQAEAKIPAKNIIVPIRFKPQTICLQ